MLVQMMLLILKQVQLSRLKCFVKEKLPNCKRALSRPIRRADDKVATAVDVITTANHAAERTANISERKV